MGKPLYYCSVCEREVFVTPSESGDHDIRWQCEHTSATIYAPRTATLYAVGGVRSLSLAERAQRALERIADAVRGR